MPSPCRYGRFFANPETPASSKIGFSRHFLNAFNVASLYTCSKKISHKLTFPSFFASLTVRSLSKKIYNADYWDIWKTCLKPFNGSNLWGGGEVKYYCLITQNLIYIYIESASCKGWHTSVEAWLVLVTLAV